MGKLIDLAGVRFGRLLAVEITGKQSRGFVWHCRCDCGGSKSVIGSDLRSGDTRSCGCLDQEHRIRHGQQLNRSHGLTHSATHRVWAGMRQRCNDRGSKDYPNYGGRGIAVCARWDTFEQFLSDMGPRPAGLSLDRIDNDGDYEPTNCRWASVLEQARNKRGLRSVCIDGSTRCLTEWIELLGISGATVRGRIARGWPPTRALTAPPDQRFNWRR